MSHDEGDDPEIASGVRDGKKRRDHGCKGTQWQDFAMAAMLNIPVTDLEQSPVRDNGPAGSGLQSGSSAAAAEGNAREVGDSVDLLILDVAGRRYGLPAEVVRELLRAAAIVPFSEAAGGVEGVINLRGTVVPVLDLRSRLHLPAKPIEPSDHFVAISHGPRIVVLRADRAIDLARVRASDLEAASGVLPGFACVSHLATRPGELVLILDLHALLANLESALPDGQATAKGPTARGEAMI